MGDLLHLIQDLLVALLRNYALLWIAAAALAAEKLLKYIL